MKIVWNNRRELKEHDCNIRTYYRDLIKLWNDLEEHIEQPDKGINNNYYDVYTNFYLKLLYMYDMIIQTKYSFEKILTDTVKQANDKNIKQPPKRMRGRKTRFLNDSQVEEAKDMKKHGKSYNQIGETFGVSGRTIRRAINGELAYKKGQLPLFGD